MRRNFEDIRKQSMTVIQLITPDFEQKNVLKLKKLEGEFNAVHSELVKYSKRVTRPKGVHKKFNRGPIINGTTIGNFWRELCLYGITDVSLVLLSREDIVLAKAIF